MPQKPILFSAPMVRALLAGRKTQTRRIKSNVEVGDLLWVRETWSPKAIYDGMPPRNIPSNETDIWYWADGNPSHGDWTKQKQSLFMPKWASRLTLKVTGIKRECLNDISTQDAIAEGLEWVAPTWGIGSIAESWNGDPVAAYAALWEHINGKGSWNQNPIVTAISFDVFDCNILKL